MSISELQMPDGEIAGRMLVIGGKPARATAVVRVEGDLVERARAGDREAFDEIYRQFAPLVHGIVLARVPYDDVKDIVQEVFLSAYRRLETLRDPNAIGAWLVRIARNEAAEHYRRSRPTVELSDDLPGRRNRRAEADEILTAIRTLPETYRETLILRLVEGMTGAEIAERTGMTPDSVRVNLHRGMDQLRQKLGISGVKR